MLGRTDLRVSVIGIGTWQLSGPLTLDGKADGFPDLGERAAVNLIHGCRDLGINFIDCAAIYGDGEGERRVGKAIQGQRDKWIVSSKFGVQRGDAGERRRDVTPQTIRSSLEATLKRLQTDYLDVYMYHSNPNIDVVADCKHILDDLKREGKLRAYGISSNDSSIIRHLVTEDAAEVVMFSQSLLTHPSALLDLAKQHKLGGLVRGVLESGRLSVKYFRTKPEFSEQDIRTHLFRGTNIRKYAAYEALLPAGATMAAFALRYVLGFNTTHSIALGAKSIQQYREAVGALAIPPLDLQTHQAIQAIRQKLSSTSLAHKVSRRIQALWS